MILGADQMAFQARALAQSHPFTPLARKVLDRDTEGERRNTGADFAVWANAAFTKGYCVRRVEEDDVGLQFAPASDDGLPDIDELDAVAGTIAAALRTDEGLHEYLISDEDRLLDVLDRIIGSEVRNRIDNASDNPSARARAELEDYLTYWVVKGYAVRAAEQATGAITKQ